MMAIKVYKLISFNDTVTSMSMFRSCLHTCAFSRNVTFISSEPIPVKKGSTTSTQILSPNASQKPLVLLYNWMLAKEKHIMKFAKIYTDLGSDVLRIRISPFDLLRPTKGSHTVANEVLDFLHLNAKFNPLLVHGFSVGAYVFCEMMVKISKNMDLHGDILDRFVGQIWDSPVDIQGIPNGLSKAITNNKIIQTSCERYLRWYLKVNYEIATKHYKASSQKMHENFVNAPGLFIFSNRDYVSTPEMNASVYKKWEANNAVYTKCFQSSAHVSHYHKYREEYESELMSFLYKIGFLHTKARLAMTS